MDDYYLSQAGSGISGFSGIRYQRGSGFFGRLISGGILPIIKKVLPYLGKKAMDVGLDIADDVMGGENFKESAQKRLKGSAKGVAADAIAKMKQMRGSGIRRRKRRRGAKVKPQKKRKTRRKAITTIKRRRTRRRRRKAANGAAADFL